MLPEELIDSVLVELVHVGEPVEELVDLVVDLEELDGVGEVLDWFVFLPVFMGLRFCFGFGLASIEEAVDVFFGHDIFLLGLGVRGTGDGLIEFGCAVLPQLVGVDRPEDVGDVPGQGSDGRTFLMLASASHVLFAMH